MANKSNRPKKPAGRKNTAPVIPSLAVLAVVAALIGYWGSGALPGGHDAASNSQNTAAIEQTVDNANGSLDLNATVEAGGDVAANAAEGTVGSATTDDVSSVVSGTGDYSATSWSAETAPDGYRVAGAAIVNYDVAPGEYHYSDLDGLNRSGVCYAGITPQNYRDELEQEREDLPKTITGWHKSVQLSVQYPGSSSDKKVYILQRSHQIADSLGGAGTVNNLVTGSAFQNTGSDNEGGMAYAETMARDWLASAADGAWLYYCVTPVYSGDELIPRSSYVDILSSDGSINQHIEVYNVIGDTQNRYYFNYSTGEVIDASSGKAVS